MARFRRLRFRFRRPRFRRFRSFFSRRPRRLRRRRTSKKSFFSKKVFGLPILLIIPVLAYFFIAPFKAMVNGLFGKK